MTLLLIGLLLILLFGGLGFVAEVLWWGLVIGVIVLIVHFVAGGRRP